MNKQIFKKIFTGTLIGLFIFSLFLTNTNLTQAQQNGLFVSVDKQSIKAGKSVNIKVSVSGMDQALRNNSIAIIAIQDTKTNAINTVNCTLTQTAPFACETSQIFFYASNFLIKASMAVIRGTINSVNEVSVTVTKDCGAQVLNKLGTACITPLTPADCPGKEVNATKNDCQQISTPVVPKCDEAKGEILNANNQCTRASDTKYTLLAPFPGTGVEEKLNTKEPCAFGNYLNLLLKLIFGLAGVLALIRIVMGGIEYMASEMIPEKGAGKETITNAIFGLILALGSFLLLNTINPDLLNTCVSLEEVYITIEEEGEEIVGDPAVICGKKTKLDNGQEATSCDKSQMQTINFMGTTVEVNKLIVSDLMAVDSAWKASTNPTIRGYKILSIGGFNPRSATGTNTTPSAHAFGLAIDINPRANPFRDSKTDCPTDMPRAFVELFTSKGFGWGGYWKNKKDAMHFSKKGNESATTGTCSGLK